MHSPDRIAGFDALRGIAVLLMVEQHLGVWLWQDQHRLFRDPLMLIVNGAGGLGAPLFIALAGLGATLLQQRTQRPDRTEAVRGAVIMLFGYGLNLAVPGWFSPGSWYVLHLIGLCLMISPVLRRCSTGQLLAGMVMVLCLSVVLQNWLQTPRGLSNARMARMDLPGGVLRLAAVDGHFPVFPWLSVFVAGMLAGRWLRHAGGRIFGLGLVCLVTGGACAVLHALGVPWAIAGPLARAFHLKPSFYPALPPVILLLTGATLLLIGAARWCDSRWPLPADNALVCLGRVSLSVLLVHVVLFREVGRMAGLWRCFSKGETLLIVAGVCGAAALAARMWQARGFRFSAEWLLRRVSG